MTRSPSAARDSDYGALAVIAGVFACGCLLVGPFRDVPVIDDWIYAWSVEHLLQTGQWRVLEISSTHPPAQILWGALFARLFGFSFGALRISTVVLSGIGCSALYLTFRELSFDRATSLLGALAVALDPVYFALSFSFMTDVPLVSLSMIAIFYYVSAVNRDQPRRLWYGSAFAVAAFLVRPLAIVLPLSVVPVLIWRTGRHSNLRRMLPALGAALVAMPVAWLVMGRTLGRLTNAADRVEQLQWLFTIPVMSYVTWTVGVLITAAFPFAPLLLASFSRRASAVVVGLASLALMLVLWLAFGGIAAPLSDWETWSLQDIGARAMFAGTLAPSTWSVRIAPVLRVAGAMTVTALLVAVARLGSQITTKRRAGVILIALGVLHLGLINLLWFYNDRYYIVFAPTFAYLGVTLIVVTGSAKRVAVALLAVWAVIAVTGTRDMLDTNETAAAAARQLEREGIPPWQIDAGYALNGWRLYAHPEHLPPDADRRNDVPFVTSDRPTKYLVANVALPGYDVLRVLPLEHAWWQVSNRLYVLRRQADGK